MVRRHGHALFLQELHSQRPCEAQRRSQTAGKLPAAAHVARIPEFFPGRKVGVAGRGER